VTASTAKLCKLLVASKIALAFFLAAASSVACISQTDPGPVKDQPVFPGDSTLEKPAESSALPTPTTAVNTAPNTSGKPISSLRPESKAAGPAVTELPQAPDRDLFQLASQLIPSLIHSAPEDIPRVVNSQPVNYRPGRKDTFWLIDLIELVVYQRPFELKLVTPHAYWYVEDGQSVRMQDLERSAAVFEETIYPRLTSAFGQEWSPGVDNDRHLNILNGVLKGAAGYYSSGDEYPEAVSPYSNEREIIYVNLAAYPVNSANYLEVLAHEFQHAIHWRADPSEETWVNEGLSEFATTIAGYPPSSIYSFLNSGPTSLLHWPLSNVSVQASYGGASLFMHYLIEHYGDPTNIKPLLEQPDDGIAGIEDYLSSQGHSADFADVFGNWMAANILDLDSGSYSYPNLDVKARAHRLISPGTTLEGSIPQYAPEYLRLNPVDGPMVLTFSAPAVTPLLPVDVGEQGCWWSNSGDSIDTTLTRRLDLRGGLAGASHPTLKYQVWYDLEENWDYAYLEVSEDEGGSWVIIDTPNASPANPVGNGYGPGYTGSSPRWLDQSIDLAPYAGKDVQLRFQYITDDAINGSGMCLRRFSLSPGPSLADQALDLSHAGWRPNGFTLINNRVRQDYIVQVIRETEEGRVTTLDLKMNESGDWIGELLIDDADESDSIVVAVAGLAPKTRLPARYTLTITPAP
jgi:immune inhibitor A